MDKLSERIKLLRLSHGWSQVDLAKKARVSPIVVFYVEKGSSGTYASSLYKLAIALEADPMEFATLLMARQNGKKESVN